MKTVYKRDFFMVNHGESLAPVDNQVLVGSQPHGDLKAAFKW